jgi:hypothetical protein
VWKGVDPSTDKKIYNFNPDIVHIHSHGLKEDNIRPLLSRLKSQGSIIIEKNVFSRPSPWFDLIDISFQLS